MLLALFFIACLLFFGIVLARKFFEDNLLVYAIPLGVLFATWLVFLTSLAIGFTEASVAAATVILLAASFFLQKRWRLRLSKTSLLSRELIPLFLISIAFFTAVNYLMFHYDAEGNLAGIRIDFGFHHAIISSLANGNFPPENPFYAGHPLIYYYFTHLFSAALMNGGFNLQAASYAPSILLNAAIACLIFLVAKTLFGEKNKAKKQAKKTSASESALARVWLHAKRNSLAYLAIALFLFNGSFAFIPYFQQNQIALTDLPTILQKPEFYYGTYYLVGFTFQTLLSSIFLLQPAFLLSFPLFFLSLLTIVKNLSKLFIGLLVGLLPMFSFFGFVLAFLFLVTYFILFDRKKHWVLPILVVLALALPQLFFFLQQRSELINFVYVRLGWMSPTQDFVFIVLFWLGNLGLYLVLAALGFYWIKSKTARAFFVSSIPPFVLGNLFIVAPYDWDNFKLFVFFFFFLALFSAFALKKLFEKNILLKIVVVILFVLMTFTGFLTLQTIISHSTDVIYSAEDVAACGYIEKNTPKNAVFLTDGQHTCLFATAGRKVFVGYTEWLKNHGYDYSKQLQENNKMLAGDCSLIKNKNISYFYNGGYLGRNAIINETFFETMQSPIPKLYLLEC